MFASSSAANREKVCDSWPLYTYIGKSQSTATTAAPLTRNRKRPRVICRNFDGARADVAVVCENGRGGADRASVVNASGRRPRVECNAACVRRMQRKRPRVECNAACVRQSTQVHVWVVCMLCGATPATRREAKLQWCSARAAAAVQHECEPERPRVQLQQNGQCRNFDATRANVSMVCEHGEGGTNGGADRASVVDVGGKRHDEQSDLVSVRLTCMHMYEDNSETFKF